jgi:hypothetical protein
MSISIDCSNKQILRIKNTSFGSLHEAINRYISEQDISVSESIQKLLYETDQDVLGGGAIYADIADYLKTKKDAADFEYLIQNALRMVQSTTYPFQQSTEKLLWDFHQAIVDYAKQLKE